MNIYFDMEFEGLKKDAKVISIGLVDDEDNELYCEFIGIDKDMQNEWVKDNVLNNTILYGDKITEDITEVENYFVGDKEYIKEVLTNWLNKYDNIQFISDVCHYDFVFLIDIFGSAFDLPKNICPYCYDINRDIMDLYWLNGKDAFDYSREDILDNLGIVIEGNKHNALYDAKVIKSIYNANKGIDLKYEN